MGGQGGSGTRGVWELLDTLSRTHHLNWHFAAADARTRDALALREAQLVPTAQTVVATHRGLGFDAASLHPGLRGEVLRRLCAFEAGLLAESRAALGNWSRGLSVVKEPVTQYLLPLLHERYAGRFRFLHITRDVRSISSYHVEGDPGFTRRYLGAEREGMLRARMTSVFRRPLSRAEARRPLFVAVWAATQADVRAWAAAHLSAGEYHQVRVEALVVERDTQAARALLAWLGVELSDGQLARVLARLGGHARRYQARNLTPALREWVEEVAGPTLRDLGYS